MDKEKAEQVEKRPVLTRGDLDALQERYEAVVQESWQGVRDSLAAPNLFNWFVGLNAVVVGLTLFLLTRLSADFQTGRFLSWFVPLQVAFILGGVGLILSEAREKKRRVWQISFRLLVAALFGVLALIWWQGADFDGVFITLWLSLVILANVVTDLSSLRSFMVYFQGLFVGLGFIYFLTPIGSRIILSQPVSIWWGWLIFFLIAVYLIVSWVSYFRSKSFLAVLIGVAGLPLLGLAYLYAGNNDWVRAFLLLLTGLFAFLMPFWDELRFRQGSKRQWVSVMFGIVVTLFLVTVILVKMLQGILLANARLILADKATYGRILIESTIGNATAAVNGLASNDIFRRAISRNQKTDLHDLSRAMFESNPSFLRVISVDNLGKVLSAYPLTIGLEGKSVASEAYFKLVVETKVVQVSNLVSSPDLEIDSPTVAIAVPVMEGKNQVGILIGFLDLRRLSDGLQEIATPGNGEYFVVMDGSGRWLVGPYSFPKEMIGDPLVGILTQKGGLKEGYSRTGELSLGAFQTIQPVTWQMVLLQPVFSALAVNQTGYLILLAVVCLSVLIIGLTVLLERSFFKESKT